MPADGKRGGKALAAILPSTGRAEVWGGWRGGKGRGAIGSETGGRGGPFPMGWGEKMPVDCDRWGRSWGMGRKNGVGRRGWGRLRLCGAGAGVCSDFFPVYQRQAVALPTPRDFPGVNPPQHGRKGDAERCRDNGHGQQSFRAFPHGVKGGEDAGAMRGSNAGVGAQDADNGRARGGGRGGSCFGGGCHNYPDPTPKG